MSDCQELLPTLTATEDDPRLSPEAVRCIEATDDLGAVILVGVVHDHPASEFRVRHAIETVNADVVAIELPPLSVPLFSRYAATKEDPPPLGGEMSIAIQTADVPVVGIDAPNRPYLSRVARALVGRQTSLGVRRSIIGDLARISAHAVVTRLGSLYGRLARPPVLYQPIQYDTSPFDTPGEQATHESAHLSTRASFLRAVQPPPSIEVIDDLREQAMADRLASLRGDGRVVAIVGMEHLDPLVAHLHRR